jgi:hypothetical protein
MKTTTWMTCGLALAGALLAAPRPAQASPYTPIAPSYVFTTVDEFEVQSPNEVVITGIINGDQAPSTQQLYIGSYTSAAPDSPMRACQAAALTMMAKPGKYLLKIYSHSAYTCALARQP